MRKSGLFTLITVMLTLIGFLGDSNQTQATTPVGYDAVSELSWKLAGDLATTKQELEAYKALEEAQFNENFELYQRIRQLEELESIERVLEIIDQNKELQDKVWKLQEENENLQRQNRNLHTGGGCAGDC